MALKKDCNTKGGFLSFAEVIKDSVEFFFKS
jgi:hypothetical protein